MYAPSDSLQLTISSMSAATKIPVMTNWKCTLLMSPPPQVSTSCPRFVPTMLSSSSYTERLPKRGGRNNAKRERLSRESDCERRRRVFLHKIQQKRDDRKWGSRNEQVRLTLQIFWIKTERRFQMLREDFLAFERLWTEQQDRSAPFPVVCPDDDDLNESTVDARFHGQSFDFT